MKKILLSLLLLPGMALGMGGQWDTNLWKAIENHQHIGVLQALVHRADLNRLDQQYDLTPPMFAVKALRKTNRIGFMPRLLCGGFLSALEMFVPSVKSIVQEGDREILKSLYTGCVDSRLLLIDILEAPTIDFNIQNSKERTVVNYIESMKDSRNPFTRYDGRILLDVVKQYEDMPSLEDENLL